MRVAVLGAGGIIAPAIVRDLAESEEVDHLKLLDLDEARARATGEAHAPDAEVERVDPDGGLGYLLERRRRAGQLGQLPGEPGRHARLPGGRAATTSTSAGCTT